MQTLCCLLEKLYPSAVPSAVAPRSLGSTAAAAGSLRSVGEAASVHVYWEPGSKRSHVTSRKLHLEGPSWPKTTAMISPSCRPQTSFPVEVLAAQSDSVS